MSYRIGEVEMRNFGPFKRLKFDFSVPGLTVVEGVMLDGTGCSSNGSGKSFLMEAPFWVITGRLIRDRVSVDDVVHGYGEGCSGRTKIIGGDHAIEIRRHRKHAEHQNSVQLYVDNEEVSRGTSDATDRAIETELGIDFMTLMNTVAFGARSDTKSFFTATDSDRKAIMQRLLGLEVYTHAQKLTRAQSREVNDEIDQIMTKEVDIATRLMEQETFLGKIEGGSDTEVRELETLEAGALVRVLQGCHSRQDRRTKQAFVDRDAEVEHHKQHKAEYDRAMDAIRQARTKIERAQREVSREAGAAESELTSIEGQVERLQSLVGGKCPTCMQTLTKKGAELASDEMRAGATDAQAVVSDVEDRLATLTASLDEIEEAPEEPSRWAVDAVDEECQMERERSLSLEQRLESAIRRHGDMKRSLAQHVGAADEIKSTMTQLTQEQDDFVARRSVLRERAERLDFWMTGFGNGGLPNFLIEAELAAINRTATVFASRLLGQGASVCLLPTKTLKTKGAQREQMVVEAKIPGCAQNYAGASKGQRHRLDLSLILALREVVSRRSTASFDQLFCDELFDGVDEAGVECVTEILRELAADRPVILVTHDPRLKSIGDRTVTVKHKGGVATL